MATPKPTVFVVDDNPGVRNALSMLMRSVDRRVETFSSATAFLASDGPHRPGCLVLDIRMPGMDGMELQERLNAIESDLPIIFITAHGDVPAAVTALKGGAVDFLQKPFKDQDLLDRIEQALSHNAQVRSEHAGRDAILGRVSSLTPREHEVMDVVVAGKANKVIAAELGLSERTVEIHRSRVMRKMQANSLAELVRMVLRSQDLTSQP